MSTIEVLHSYQAKGVLKSYFALNPPVTASSANALCISTFARKGKVSTSVVIGILDVTPTSETFSYNYPDDFGMNAANAPCRATTLNLRKQHQQVIGNLGDYIDLAHDFYRKGVVYAAA